MERIFFVVGGVPVTGAHLLVGALAAALLALVLVVALVRAGTARRREREAAEERHEEIEAQMSALSRTSIEMTARLQTVAEVFGSRQSDLARLVSERLDAVGHRLGQGLESSSKTTTDNLGKLNERLAVIDAAQTASPISRGRCWG